MKIEFYFFILIIFLGFLPSVFAQENISLGVYAYEIEVNPNESILYVSTSGSRFLPSGDCQNFVGIAVFDETTLKLLDHIDLSVRPGAYVGISFDEKSNTLYTSFGKGNSTLGWAAIDGSTNEITFIDEFKTDRNTSKSFNPNTQERFHTNLTIETKGIFDVVHPETGLIYKPGLFSRSLYVINPDTLENEHIIKINDGPEYVTINPNTDVIYVASGGNLNWAKKSITLIDGTTYEIIKKINLEINPYDIYIDPSTNNLYVFGFRSQSVLILDGETLEKIAELKSDKGATDIAVNKDSGKIYSLNSKLGQGLYSLSIIDISSNTISNIESTYEEILNHCPVSIDRPSSLLTTYVNLEIIFSLILLGMIYLSKIGGKSSSKGINKIVNVKLQVLFSILPTVWVLALYNIKSLRKGLALQLVLKIGLTTFIIYFLVPFPYYALIYFGITVPLFVYFFLKWSRDWNQRRIVENS